MKALFLAGGMGTRLKPLTDDLPKPMVPMMGAPLLERNMLKLKDCGHSPQRDQPAAVIAASVAFISSAATRPALRKGSEDLL